MKRVETLNEYYSNLDYHYYKEKALQEIYHLTETLRLHNVACSDRLEILADIIRKNISHFRSICRHVDEIDTTLEYLTETAVNMKCILGNKNEFFKIFSLMFTLLNIWEESRVQSFFLQLVCADAVPIITRNYPIITEWLNTVILEREMIILEDSDLHAVINSLIITSDFSLHKIWVQEQVKEKLLWLMKRHSVSCTIDAFQSLKDIPRRVYLDDEYILSIVSIWSEDTVTAKNLALSLHSHVIFINAHMDFSGSIVCLPYEKIVDRKTFQMAFDKIREEESDSTDSEESINLHSSHIPKKNYTSICNLFYDGTWQEPVKGMYCERNNKLWANATNDDIIRCYESASKGIQTWAITSIEARIQILATLETMLKLNGKAILATIVERSLKFPFFFPTVQGHVSSSGTIEVITLCKSLGIIILKEKNENVLFLRLMQTLIAGNSVIVIFDANFCALTPYCNMFSTCGIPPGVINLLSHENVSRLELKLCTTTYADYTEGIFFKNNRKETYIEQHKQLTMPQQIIIRLK